MTPTMSVTREHAGTLRCGSIVEAFTLAAGGYRARVLTYGAALQAYTTPDRDGHFDDILLGFDTPAEYEAHRLYMGVTVGRYANRISGGGFCLDGHFHRLEGAPGEAVLHGGATGFDRQIWRVVAMGETSVTLAHTSGDGAGGFPGEVAADVTYALAADGRLTIAMSATTTAPTVIAMTNHASYNLAGQASDDLATAMHMTIPASHFTPVGPDMIPTGAIAAVAGTALDFRQGRVVAEALAVGDPHITALGGLDHNFVLDAGLTLAPKPVVTIAHAPSGRTLTLCSTEPGLQVYSGVCFDGTLRGKGAKPYRQGEGLALEPQKFPDTPNHPAFGSARLDPGQTYRHIIELVPGLLAP